MITHLSSTKPKEEELNDTDTPDLHDRVYDAYYGKLGKKFMHETQRRINWICSQVTGNRVLDIGCSQGISSILLGREGKEVTGIDVDSTAINSAQNHLSHESRPVRENIKFLNADAANHTFDTKAFDTVILSEILEHLINPERIIRVASEQLCLGGKLVVTIPFGINDYIDHKKTFYLLEPYQIISKHFKIVDVLVIGHWLGIVAVDEKLESDKIRPPSFTSQLINKLEEGFLDIEQELRNELATTKNKLHDANLKYRSSTERLTSDRKKLTEEKSARARVETNHKLIESQLEKSERIIHLERLNSVESQKSLTRSETNLARFKDDAEKYKKSHNKSKTRIKGLKNHLLESKKDIKARKERAKKINNKLQSLQQNNIKANNKVTMLEDHIEALVLNAQKDTEITTKLEDQLFVINKDLARAKETILELQESLSLSQLDTNKYENLQLDLDKSSKKTKATKEQVNNLSSELDILKSHEREQHSKLARSKAEAIRNRIDISQSHDQIESLRQQIQIANQQVAKTRATLSFQLGHALIFSPKSIGNLKSLPGKLWTLHKEAKIRRSKRKALPFHKPLVTALQTNFAPTAESTDQAPKRAVNLKLVSSQPSNLPEILKALKVATIMDEFTYGSYQDECNLLQLTPQHWQKELASFRPEMLFIESAWRGKNDLWGNKVGHMSQEVVSIIDWCHENKVPTIFWNKEDPVHFETFLSTAKLFNYVFTTDIDCIHRYKAALGHEHVYLLPFAAQPTLSNPIEKHTRKDAICFAGAYYTRYPERTRDLGNFLATLQEFKPVEIYDRNYGKDDPNYKFPAEYQPFIVGNLPFDQIDKAYKGYNYAINLNSIKQSQSMFARRVFDLLASNTVTVSNFSRGIRLMFGDLLISTDNGMEALRQLEALVDNEQSTRKLRLAALRKVMREHTYQDRLAYVLSKVRNQDNQSLLPNIVVNSYAKNQQQADSIFNSFQQQSHANKSLVLVVPGGFEPANVPEDERILIIAAPKAQDQNLIDLGSPKDWLAVMVPDDYYGTNYLLDLAIATRYAQAPVIGKATIYVFSTNSGINISNKGEQYRRVSQIPARSGIIKINQAENITLREWVGTLYTKQLEHQDALSIDEFNYCKNAGVDDFHSTQKMIVDDLPRLNSGLALQDIISQAEQIPPEAQDSTATPHLNGNDLAALFYQPPARTQVSISVQGKLLQIDSALEDGKHEYWYSIQDHLPQELGAKDGHLAFYLEVTPGLNIQLTLLFLDAQKQRISHVVKTANRNQEAELPAGTKYVRLGLRVYAAGSSRIHALLLGHRKLQPAEVLATGEHLLLTNHYPSDNDLYRNGFVHSRVVAYKKQGLKVDVFRLRNGEPLSYHEFGNVDCITGSQEALHQLLTSGHHKSVLVHFLDEDMWDVLKHHIDQTKMVVWVHGAEIQPFHRREYNYNTEEARKTGKIQSEKRMKFWRSLLQSMPSNLQLVFVSQYFAEEVMEDLGFRLPESQYKIIHNPIDTNLFHHETKPAEQRMRILSVRPYASAKYANDLSVEAILKLSKKPWFNELEFRIIGDGILFEETLSPLRKFRNIHIEQRFLSQKEIAQLHKSYGLFLCPTRMDAQGVSRDEAMSSGLVPVTNAVAAIPEFVDRNSGILAPGEDAEAMAEGIERLYHNPELFAAMSKEAARRVRTQTSNELIIKQEFQEIVDIEDS